VKTCRQVGYLRCPACLSDGGRQLRRRAAGLRIAECDQCSLVFAHPLERGATGEVGAQESSITDHAYYDNILALHRAQEGLAEAKIDLLLETYRSKFNLAPKRVVEIGCGTGQLYRAWNERGIEWLGVEANPRMVSFCADHGKPVISADELNKLQPHSCDLVYLSQVLEHVLEPRPFLSRLHTLLAPSGAIHIDVPNHDSSVSRYRRWNVFAGVYGFVQPPHHLIAYRKKSLQALLVSLGFRLSLLENFPNDDPIFGQLLVKKSPLHSLVMKCDAALGTGSLLVAIAQAVEAPAESKCVNAP
jgi:SAM-dependent methyltransferase